MTVMWSLLLHSMWVIISHVTIMWPCFVLGVWSHDCIHSFSRVRNQDTECTSQLQRWSYLVTTNPTIHHPSIYPRKKRSGHLTDLQLINLLIIVSIPFQIKEWRESEPEDRPRNFLPHKFVSFYFKQHLRKPSLFPPKQCLPMTSSNNNLSSSLFQQSISLHEIVEPSIANA